MQFWKITLLKRRLAANQVGPREVLLYFVAFSAVDAIALGIPLSDPNIWDYVDAITGVLVLVFGSVYCYVENGGDEGISFLERYFAISWVFMLRYAVMVMVPSMVAVLYAWEFFGGVPDESTAGQSTLIILLEIGYILGVARHLKQLRLGQKTA